MRERMKQEKAKSNKNKGTGAQQKKLLSEEKTGGQKKKKKTKLNRECERERTGDNRQGRKTKKKEQNQERQRFLLEARKAQLASRWAANGNVDNPASATFTPELIGTLSINCFHDGYGDQRRAGLGIVIAVPAKI